MSKSLSRLLAAMTCAASLSVYAADANDPQRPRQPPQAALDACKSATEGATCQFTGRNDETVAGTCKAPRNSEEKSPLVCRPDRKDWKPKDGAEKDHTAH